MIFFSAVKGALETQTSTAEAASSRWPTSRKNGEVGRECKAMSMRAIGTVVIVEIFLCQPLLVYRDNFPRFECVAWNDDALVVLELLEIFKSSSVRTGLKARFLIMRCF